MIAVNLFNYLESSIQGVFVLGENGFRKYFSVNAGVWLRMKNTFFGNAFQFDRVLGVKSFPFLFYLQISFSKKQREREREPIVDEHKPSTLPANSKLQSDDRTHQIALFSSITALRRSHHTARSRLHLSSPPRDLTFNSEPSTHRSLYRCVILIFVVVVVVWQLCFGGCGF